MGLISNGCGGPKLFYAVCQKCFSVINTIWYPDKTCLTPYPPSQNTLVLPSSIETWAEKIFKKFFYYFFVVPCFTRRLSAITSKNSKIHSFRDTLMYIYVSISRPPDLKFRFGTIPTSIYTFFLQSSKTKGIISYEITTNIWNNHFHMK